MGERERRLCGRGLKAGEGEWFHFMSVKPLKRAAGEEVKAKQAKQCTHARMQNPGHFAFTSSPEFIFKGLD
jgi:hypothetical protein